MSKANGVLETFSCLVCCRNKLGTGMCSFHWTLPVKSPFLSAASVIYQCIHQYFYQLPVQFYTSCLTLHMEFCPGLSSLLWEAEMVLLKQNFFAEPIILVSATQHQYPLTARLFNRTPCQWVLKSLCQSNSTADAKTELENFGPSAKFLVHWDTFYWVWVRGSIFPL